MLQYGISISALADSEVDHLEKATTSSKTSSVPVPTVAGVNGGFSTSCFRCAFSPGGDCLDMKRALVFLSIGQSHKPTVFASCPEWDMLHELRAQKYEVSLYIGWDDVCDCHHRMCTSVSRVKFPLRVNMAVFPTC